MRLISWLINGLLFFVMVQSGSIFAQTIIEGVTYRLDNGNYSPLAGVGVVAVRYAAGPASAHPVQSDGKGHFQLSVPLGGPILVLFYGDKRVPQLQQLAGNQTRNLVHVTLYTPKEYQDLHPYGPSLKTKYGCLLQEIPKESEASRIVQRSIDGN